MSPVVSNLNVFLNSTHYRVHIKNTAEVSAFPYIYPRTKPHGVTAGNLRSLLSHRALLPS